MRCGRWSHSITLRWAWMRALIVAVGGPKELLDPCGPWVEAGRKEVFTVFRNEDGQPIEGTKRITALLLIQRCEKCGALTEHRFKA